MLLATALPANSITRKFQMKAKPLPTMPRTSIEMTGTSGYSEIEIPSIRYIGSRVKAAKISCVATIASL